MNFLRRFQNHWLVAGVWTVLALVVLWQYDLVGRKLDADASFMLYAGQQILRGYAPYVGVAIVKLPVSPIVAALGIAIGRVFGIEDLIGGRLAFWLSAGLTVGATYLVGAQLVPAIKGFQTDSHPVRDPKGFEADAPPVASVSETLRVLLGSLAAVALLTSQALGIQVTEGPEAKLPMICAGMFCLVLIDRRKFFWAGVAGALSFMAWQPGLIFVAAVVVCAFVVGDKKRPLWQAAAGIALPIVVIGVYLALNGALASMFHQAFGANANYFGEQKASVGIFQVVLSNVSRLWEVSRDCSLAQVPLVGVGYVGMIGGGLFLFYRFLRTRDMARFLAAFPLLLSAAALFGFSLLDLQKCSDMTPLLPYLGLGTGAFFFFVVMVVGRVFGRILPEMRVAVAVGVVLVAFVLFYGTRATAGQSHQTGIAEQRALSLTLEAQLQPDDRVQEFGDTVMLVLTRRQNATRFVHLGDKQGFDIWGAEGINVEQFIAQLQAANPRLITLSRAKDKVWAKPLYDWIESRYTLGSSYGASDGGTKQVTDVYWLK